MQPSPTLQAAAGLAAAQADVPRAAHVPPSAVSKKQHMPALDGLRGLAAISVVISHLPTKTPFWGTVNFGECGVFLFFVLSGFLMAHLHLQQPFTGPALRRFCVARIARIVPLYYTVVLISFLVTQVWNPEFHYTMSVTQLIRQLAFVGSVGVFWSVGPEFQFYGFFLVLWAIPQLQGAMRTLALILLALFALACYATSPYLPGVLFVSKLHIFLGGVAVAMTRWWLANRAGPNTAMVRALQLAACAAVVGLLLPYPHMMLPVFPAADVSEISKWYYTDLPRVVLAGVVVLGFSYRTAMSDALLGNRLVSELGRSSFSIYLLHMPVMDVMHHFGLFERLGPWGSSLCCIAAVVLLSSLVNRMFESPARRWVTERLGPARHRQPATT